MSITLKEAFRYQNFFDRLIGEAMNYLRSSGNFMVITETHLRSKAIASAEDEVKDNLSDRTIDVSPDILVAFIMKVYSEKEMLAKAINNAKNLHCSEMDMMMSMNRTRQNIVEVLKRMVRTKGRESVTRGSAYTLNSEGNQVQYYYDIKQTSVIDFDRVHLKKLISDMAAESDRVSATLDYWLTSVPVDYSPAFDLNDTLEELVEDYKLTKAS